MSENPISDSDIEPDSAPHNREATIEENKRRAARGWLSDPPPRTAEPLPAAHVTKWFRIMGATYLLPD